jgi:hypothetical protein
MTNPSLSGRGSALKYDQPPAVAGPGPKRRKSGDVEAAGGAKAPVKQQATKQPAARKKAAPRKTASKSSSGQTGQKGPAQTKTAQTKTAQKKTAQKKIGAKASSGTRGPGGGTGS